MKIKAVLIDIDNTILDFNRSAIIASEKVASRHSVSLPENYPDIFHRINDELWGQLECGNIEKSDIYEMRFMKIFEEAGISADCHAFEEDFRKEMRLTAEKVPGAEEILSYLSSKYPVYTASNASRFQQAIRLEKAGLSQYLSGMFASEDIGFQKPAKEFFCYCCEQLYPVKPSEIIMIGDNISADIIGAKNFGLKSIWFNYKGEAFDSYSFTDFYVDKLRDIRNIL